MAWGRLEYYKGFDTLFIFSDIVKKYNYSLTETSLKSQLKSEKYYELNMEDYFKFLIVYFKYFVKIKFKLTFFSNSRILIMFYCNLENILEEKADLLSVDDGKYLVYRYKKDIVKMQITNINNLFSEKYFNKAVKIIK